MAGRNPNIIGRGGYRTTRRHTSFTVSKFQRPQRYLQVNGLTFRLPSRLFAAMTMGSRSANKRERINYEAYFQHVPHVFRNSFPSVLGINPEGELIMQKVRGKERGVASTLFEHGPVKDPFFWSRFNEIVQWFIKKKIHLFDLNPHNIVVGQEKGHLIPVFIDYKSVGVRHNLFKFWRGISFLARREVLSRARKLENQFSSRDNS